MLKLLQQLSFLTPLFMKMKKIVSFNRLMPKFRLLWILGTRPAQRTNKNAVYENSSGLDCQDPAG